MTGGNVFYGGSHGVVIDGDVDIRAERNIIDGEIRGLVRVSPEASGTIVIADCTIG